MNVPCYAADPNGSFSGHAEFYRSSAYAEFDQQHFSGGTFDANLIMAHQGPIDMVDPRLPEIVIQCGSFQGSGGDMCTDVGYGLTSRQAGPGRVFVAPAGTQVHYRIDRPHSVLCLAIPETRFRDLVADYGLTADCLDRYADGLTENSAAWSDLQRLWRAQTQINGTNDLLFDALVLKLLASLTMSTDALLGEARPEDVRIARVIDYIEAHFGDPLNLGDLAAVACLSPAHLSRTFKATVGEPVWSYVTRRRCERAKEMLIKGCLPIAEIAYRCGFSHQAHLTKLFSDYFGVTPGAFRRDSR